jgi:prolyl-tRNA synthetase
VEALPAEAFSGAMGGRESIEFMVRTPAGEDEVIRCTECGYTANAVVARSIIAPEIGDGTEVAEVPEEFPTPGALTIDALASIPDRW